MSNSFAARAALRKADKGWRKRVKGTKKAKKGKKR